MAREVSLAEPPTDGISAVKFSPFSDSHLVSSSWDTYVRVYDASKPDAGAQAKYQHRAPVLDAVFTSDRHVASGGLDQSVKIFDITTGRETVLGAHSAPVRCVEWAPEQSALVTGSWDGTVRLWDPRRPGAETAKFKAPGKVYSMSLAPEAGLVVAACADRRVVVLDVRTGRTLSSRESLLKHQLRVVRVMPDTEEGFITGSIEGRCSVEFVEEGGGGKAYPFKCHRLPDPAVPGEDRIFPVNAVAFHPGHGTFATGGGDGRVFTWDWRAKKKVSKGALRECETSVAALSFDRAGGRLAIAVSYTWEQGERPHPADAIVIRDVADADIKPKA